MRQESIAVNSHSQAYGLSDYASDNAGNSHEMTVEDVIGKQQIKQYERVM